MSCTALHEIFHSILVIHVMLESASYSVVENETVELCVTLIGELEREVQLSVVSQPGNAQQHEDYIAIMDTLTLHPGDNKTCFSVETVEDNLVEGEETFQLVLNGDDPAVVITFPNTITISIRDNDSKLLS